jgi:hypothetical protein
MFVLKYERPENKISRALNSNYFFFFFAVFFAVFLAVFFAGFLAHAIQITPFKVKMKILILFQSLFCKKKKKGNILFCYRDKEG